MKLYRVHIASDGVGTHKLYWVRSIVD